MSAQVTDIQFSDSGIPGEPVQPNYTFFLKANLTKNSGTVICRQKWEMVRNGRVISYFSNDSTHVAVDLADVYGTAVFRYTVWWQDATGKCPDGNKFYKETPPLAIRSVTNTTPRLVAAPNQNSNTLFVNHCATSALMEIEALLFPQTSTGGGGEVDGYEITLPVGWTSGTLSGTFISPTHFIPITIPDQCSEATIQVRAYNSCAPCTNKYSNPLTVQVKRNPSLGIVSSKPNLLCGDVAPITFSISALSCVSNYNWTVPSGWSIQSGQGTRQMVAIPNGLNAGEVKSVLTFNNCTPITLKFNVGFNTQLGNVNITQNNNYNVFLLNETLRFTANVQSGFPSNYIWTLSGGSNWQMNGQNVMQITTTNNWIDIKAPNIQSFAATLTVKAKNNCNVETLPSVFNLWVGKPSGVGITFIDNNGICPGNTGSICYGTSGGTIVLNSTANNPYISINQNCVTFGGNSLPGTYPAEVFATATNRAGSLAPVEVLNGYTVNDCGGGGGTTNLVLSPNPAQDYVEVQTTQKSIDTNYEIQIVDKLGQLVEKHRFKGNKYRMDIQKLKKGIYYLQLVSKEGILQKQLVIQK